MALQRTNPSCGGGWAGVLAYELGGWIEPSCAGRAHQSPGTMLFDLHRIDKTDTLHNAGADESAYELGQLTSQMGRNAYGRMIEDGVEYIRAGDIFQANLTHSLAGSFSGSAHGLFEAMMARSGAAYGAFIESTSLDGTRERVVSASPELLVRFDASTRKIITRPIKGTARAGEESTLLESMKDEAELNMIVDLMRNDIGRVCETGSVRVRDHRVLEQHAGHGGDALVHTVSTVEGVVRTNVDTTDVIRAVFPAGSITGAPKIRAMQVIDELEHGSVRGAYTGSVAWFDDDGSFELSVGIRTAVIREHGVTGPGDLFTNGSLRFGVGGGIVAQSVAHSEWEESLAKGGLIRSMSVQHPEVVT